MTLYKNSWFEYRICKRCSKHYKGANYKSGHLVTKLTYTSGKGKNYSKKIKYNIYCKRCGNNYSYFERNKHTGGFRTPEYKHQSGTMNRRWI